MKKLFMLLSLSTAAVAAAPSVGFAKLVLDLPPILAGKTVPNNQCAEYAGCPTGPCYPECTANPCQPCEEPNQCAEYAGCPTGPCYPECTANPCQPCEGPAAGGLNDTGITWSGTGATGNNTGTTCSDAAQDCSYGWDATDGRDAADGHAGFKFTKLDSSGKETASTHECVRDERTGLIWEVKSSTSVNWSTAKTNAASFTACNVSAGNWRLPTVKELLSIVSYYDISAGPVVDTAYFTANPSSYWTGTELSSDTSNAWAVNFIDGSTKQLAKKEPYRFRLVYKAAQ